MCLIGFRFDPDGDQPLLLAANRDEFLSRPTQVACWWADATDLYGGRDLQAGGTWMAVSLPGFDDSGSRRCRFAALTNYRDGQTASPEQRSRGELVTRILNDSQTIPLSLQAIAGRDGEYAGFNLIAFEWQESKTGTPVSHCRGWRLSNRASEAGQVQSIEPGIHGVSNGQFNEPWPKTRTLIERIERVDPQSSIQSVRTELLGCLTDQSRVPDELLPSTGLPSQSERELACLFIRASLDQQTHAYAYGTRSSAIVALDNTGGFSFDQWTWRTDQTEPVINEYRRMQSRPPVEAND